MRKDAACQTLQLEIQIVGKFRPSFQRAMAAQTGARTIEAPSQQTFPFVHWSPGSHFTHATGSQLGLHFPYGPHDAPRLLLCASSRRSSSGPGQRPGWPSGYIKRRSPWLRHRTAPCELVGTTCSSARSSPASASPPSSAQHSATTIVT